MQNDSKLICCENCGRPGVQVRRVTRSYGKGASLLVVEGVPVISCPHCGASYLTASTLHEIARLKVARRKLVKHRSVAVAEFVPARKIRKAG
jgi:YgiT-type zinc finger domain-containing protein